MRSSGDANLIIIQLLHTSSDPNEFLRLCWDQLFPLQKMQIYHYLYLAKQENTFVQILQQELALEEPVVPWTHLFALLVKWKKLSPETLRSLINTESDSLDAITFRINTPELNELWARKKQQKLAKLESKKQSLMKDLEFAKNQGLKEKRIEALNQLKKFFPNDKVVETAFQSEKEFRARHSHNKLSTKKEKQGYHKKEAPLLNANEIQEIFKTIKKHLKKNADTAYDFSVMFMEMDLPILGLNVIDLLKKKSQKMLWYELTLSIEGQQYARALNTIALIQKKKVNSDQSFSLLYYQALALYGLGNKSDAIRIIKNILKIRPQFKSANSLLLEWGIEI